MRVSFIHALCDLAERDRRIVLLTGDLGYGVLEPFRDRFPEYFFNVGVAEQNMIGLSTGLAEAGFIPFVYSIATFVTLRGYEFIRNGPVLHGFPVRIMGVGAGFDYSFLGSTHYALEDVGVMRIQPGITVVVPADHEQAQKALRETWDLPGPIYYRLGRDESRIVPGLNGQFRLGRASVIREGGDVLFVTMGAVASEAAMAAEELAGDGIHATVVVVSTLSPPTTDLEGLVAEHSVAITVEDHYSIGGLGSLVAEIIAEHGIHCRLIRLGVTRLPVGHLGSTQYQRARHGLDHSSLVKLTNRLVAGGPVGLP